jgi:ubiquinone biosynthesis monooxygenase Coq6
VTKNLKVGLIESQPLSKVLGWDPPLDEYSNRASSLTPSSVSFLETIGAWKHVEQSRVQPYNEMQVWDGSNGSKIQLDWSSEAERYNSPLRTVATMAENANLSKGLLSRVKEAEEGMSMDGKADHRGSLMFNSPVSSINSGLNDQEGLNLSSWPVVSVSSSDSEAPNRLAARLLVGADGANSPVRTFAGIPSKGWDYHRHGVVATLNLEPQPEFNIDSFFSAEAPKVTAYQRFLPTIGGPIALLPFPNGKASLVWSTTPANAAYLKSLSPDTFTTMVNAAFRLSMTDLLYMFTLPASEPLSSAVTTYTHIEELSWRLQHTPLPSHLPPLIRSIQPGSVASFPLRFRQSSSYVSPRIALIGDAAHTIHPLAGQGLNLGLGDARALFQTIEGAMLRGQDLGDAMMTLGEYNRERWGKGALIGGTCDVLNRLYGVDGGLLGWGRGVGMEMVDSLQWVKGWVMGQAEGR